MVELLALYKFIAEKFFELDPSRGLLLPHPIPYDDARTAPAEKEFFEALSRSNYTYFAKDPKTKQDDKSKRALTDHFLKNVLSTDKCKTAILAYLLSKQQAPAPTTAPATIPANPEELEKLKTENAKYQKQASDLEATVKTWKDRTMAYGTENSELRTRLKDTSGAENALENVRSLSTKLSEQKEAYKELHNEFQQRTKDHQSLQKKLEKLESEKLNAKHQDDEYQKMRTEMFAKNSQIQELARKVKQLESRAEKEYQEIYEDEAADEERVDYKKELEKKDERIQELKAQVKELRQKQAPQHVPVQQIPEYKELEAKVKAKDAQIGDLRSKVDKYRTDASKNQTTQQLEERIKHLTDNYTQQQADAQQRYKADLAMRDKEIAGLQQKIKDLSSRPATPAPQTLPADARPSHIEAGLEEVKDALAKNTRLLQGFLSRVQDPSSPASTTAPASPKKKTPSATSAPAQGGHTTYRFTDNYENLILDADGERKQLHILWNGSLNKGVELVHQIYEGTYKPPTGYETGTMNRLNNLATSGLVRIGKAWDAALTPLGESVIKELEANRPDILEMDPAQKAPQREQPGYPKPGLASPYVSYQFDADGHHLQLEVRDGTEVYNRRITLFDADGKMLNKTYALHRIYHGDQRLEGVYTQTLVELKVLGMITSTKRKDAQLTPIGREIVEKLPNNKDPSQTPNTHAQA